MIKRNIRKIRNQKNNIKKNNYAENPPMKKRI